MIETDIDCPDVYVMFYVKEDENVLFLSLFMGKYRSKQLN